MLVHCPIIAEVFHKINTFFQKNANIFLVLPLTRACCGGKSACPQDVAAAKSGAKEKFLVKRKIFGRKWGVRQNAEKESVTILSRFSITVMSTERTKKVPSRACGKTCGECGKLKFFNGILSKGAGSHPAKTPRKSSQKWKKLRFGMNYVDTCTQYKIRRYLANCFHFLSSLPKNPQPAKLETEYFCWIFTKRVFV
ncbi:MAG: hypothetical protein IKB80_05925 [Oscillospiraceae bacterium]|nr:hypothetical protein [Oscillospiraceae bacterium]